MLHHETKTANTSSIKASSSQYYEKMEQHLSRYESLRASISNYFACLSRLICLLPIQPEFKKINILYFQFLLCKQMKWNMKTLKEALKACMDISQVGEVIGKEELDECENEVENYYSESFINLQVLSILLSFTWLTGANPTLTSRNRCPHMTLIPPFLRSSRADFARSLREN